VSSLLVTILGVLDTRSRAGQLKHFASLRLPGNRDSTTLGFAKVLIKTSLEDSRSGGGKPGQQCLADLGILGRGVHHPVGFGVRAITCIRIPPIFPDLVVAAFTRWTSGQN
jgi:hypothetical protein